MYYRPIINNCRNVRLGGVVEFVSSADQLGGMRSALEDGEAILGYEPQEGFGDRCWLLHEATEDGKRVLWSDVLARAGKRLEDWPHNLSFRVFAGLEKVGDVRPEDIGVIDRESLGRLVEVLARHSPDEMRTDCYWAQAGIECLGAEGVAVRRGRLEESRTLYELCDIDNPDWCESQFPAHWWPLEGSWFVSTNWDLSATEVFGPPPLIADLLADDRLEVVRHLSIADVDRRDPCPSWGDVPPSGGGGQGSGTRGCLLRACARCR